MQDGSTNLGVLPHTARKGWVLVQDMQTRGLPREALCAGAPGHGRGGSLREVPQAQAPSGVPSQGRGPVGLVLQDLLSRGAQADLRHGRRARRPAPKLRRMREELPAETAQGQRLLLPRLRASGTKDLGPGAGGVSTADVRDRARGLRPDARGAGRRLCPVRGDARGADVGTLPYVSTCRPRCGNRSGSRSPVPGPQSDARAMVARPGLAQARGGLSGRRAYRSDLDLVVAATQRPVPRGVLGGRLRVHMEGARCG